MQIESKKSLGLFQLVMIAIVSVDSLRNLPIGAQYGLSLVSFYIFAAMTFFLPLTWIASQLSVRFPNTGGSYLWVEAAFGKTFGYLSIFLQWTYNIIWYPTIFAFVSSTMISLVYPDLANNRWFILISCTALFWLITFIHSFGLRASSWISLVSTMLGTLFPMLVIIVCAVYWLLSGKPSATPLTLNGLLPDTNAMHNLAYFSNILFSLLGIEVIAMHAGNVKNPDKNFPGAFMISAAVILSTLILSSLALCIVVPAGKIMLLSGIIDVVKTFFANYELTLWPAIIGWCIVLGGFGVASSWMIALARGLGVALTSTNVPNVLKKLNHQGVPVNVLCFQGCVYTILLSAFILLPNVNSSYWLLSALSAQFALIYYIILFSAAFKLLRSDASSVLKKILGTVLPFSAGIVSFVGIAVGFLPPANVASANIVEYELFMVLSLFVFCVFPFLVLKKKHG